MNAHLLHLALPAGEAGAEGGADFATLRSAGIAALQRLCGEGWTDYNLHDPGVTILEQLAYGLTDLAYRTGFDMADYLAGPDGEIDYAALALYPPEEILPCAPLTAEDYRRLLYGEIAELTDVWVRAEGGGLVSIDVMAAPDTVAGEVPGTDEAALVRRVRDVYAAQRALGADLARVRVVAPQAYYLRGEIDTDGERPLAEVLAEVLFACGEYLSSGLSARRLRDVIALGWAPERVYDGPSTRHGYVGARRGQDLGAPVTVSELIGVIQGIAGVCRIRTLAIVDAALQPVLAIPRDHARGSCGVLPFPSGEPLNELLRVQPEQGIEYGVSEQLIPATPGWRAANRLLYEEARLELAKLRFEQRAFRAGEGGARTRYPLPTGTHRALHAYYSVQHEFPAVYGIGRYGLPDSASAERKAQARQLKGFLYPMEQLMANYLQNLQDLPRLFGIAHEAPRSYGAQALDEAALPGVAELYADPPEVARQRVAAILARHDDHMERKSRVYDYLLALYGESFPQAALRRFNHYHPHDTDAWLLDAKRRLLEAVVVLGGRRGLGADYTLAPDAPGAVAPLAWRAAILLGFDGGDRGRSLLPQWEGAPLALAEGGAQQEPAAPPGDWLPVPPAQGAAAAPPEDLVQAGMAQELLRDGAQVANYRLARSSGEYHLHVQAGPHWRLLGRYGRRADAVSAAHAAAAVLAQLNRGSEGMHIVEHVLLRPRVGHGAGEEGHRDPAFYDARISVVLPGWTLRCADRSFRNFAEDTVRAHCPAHIQPAFLWLAPLHMAQFEFLEDAWRDALRARHDAAEGEREGGREACDRALHDAAGALVHFLRAHRKEPA